MEAESTQDSQCNRQVLYPTLRKQSCPKLESDSDEAIRPLEGERETGMDHNARALSRRSDLKCQLNGSTGNRGVCEATLSGKRSANSHEGKRQRWRETILKGT